VFARTPISSKEGGKPLEEAEVIWGRRAVAALSQGGSQGKGAVCEQTL